MPDAAVGKSSSLLSLRCIDTALKLRRNTDGPLFGWLNMGACVSTASSGTIWPGLAGLTKSVPESRLAPVCKMSAAPVFRRPVKPEPETIVS